MHYIAPAGFCPSCGLKRGPLYDTLMPKRRPLPWLMPAGAAAINPAGCGCGSSMVPAGQAENLTTWWNSEPIKFSSKNYVIGTVVGLVVGAGAVLLYKRR